MESRNNYKYFYVIIGIIMTLLLQFSIVKSSSLIDSMSHEIVLVNKSNWESKIGKFRSSHVFPVVFFKKNEESKKILHGVYNEVAKFLKGLITVAAVDCDESLKLCNDNDITEYPTLKIYPIQPIPSYVFKDITKNAIINQLSNIMRSKVLILDTSNSEKFLNENPSIPNVVLISDKEKPPFLFRALSNAFENKLNFGFVNAKNNENLAKKFKAVKYPHLIVVRKEKKNEIFKGEMKSQILFEWLNVFSETFVIGGGFDEGPSGGEPPLQPWKYQSIPEMTIESHMDICFKKTDQGLCVVYLRGDGGLDENELTMLERLKETHRSQLLGRGAEFRWSWMNIDNEKNFFQLFQPSQLPAVVVFNPHKRLRFTTSQELASEETIKQLLEKISGGDARFTNVKGQKLPPFAEKKESKEKSKDEL